MTDVVATGEAENFGAALRYHRSAAGFTQEELAERAGISPRSISGLERGEGFTPRRDTVALLVRALGLAALDRQVFEAMVRRRPSPRPGIPHVPLRPSADGAADRPRHNVPRSLTSFVGREQDMSELERVQVRAPLVTLVGPGGVGKTRLAQEFTRLHGVSYTDGAWIVELADLAESSLVAGAIAAAVGLPDFTTRNGTHILTDYLRPKHVLLVLDNCEHLLHACAELVAHLLRMCPNVYVLATSREPLAIDGEVTWLVHPLELPDPHLRQSADHVARLAAVRLFIDRARAVDHTFELTEDNAAAVGRVCTAVDGIPLGIELAAARTRLLSVEQLGDRLEHAAHILSGSYRDATARHRTIRASIDWSHDLLGEREQILLRRLSVFANGWTLDMAEDVCSGAGINRSDVLDVLSRLVGKSMVVMTARDAVAHYRLLEPIRHYAWERLESSGEASSYAARHAATILSLPRSAKGEEYANSPSTTVWRARSDQAA